MSLLSLFTFVDYSTLWFVGHDVEHYAYCIAKHCKALLERYTTTRGNVIAGVVMTHSYRYAKFVSAGMGTNFIHEQEVDYDGSSVVDCHAEILAKRGLNRYLLLQMKAAQCNEESIFRVVNGQFVLNSHVKFHLYVSKVPCGDATIPIECHGKACLRYWESGGGGNVVRVRDNGWYKMSCSDKIALWNVVGVQGALLFQLLQDPVYLSTIIVDDKDKDDDCEERAERAFISRLAFLAINKPDIVVINSDCKPVPKQGNHKAYCWVASDGDGEELDSHTGRKVRGTTDVSKRALFELWSEISVFDVPLYKTYHECKREVYMYQLLKKIFYFYFTCLGSELFAKPEELDHFFLY